MDEKKTIIKNDPQFLDYLDFDKLRNEGIGYIASFSGKVWTDHNLHDPGITILEALCYVLTDLDYRTRFNFKDLVARKENGEDNFFTPAQMLGNNPLTITDFRKLLIDIPGVRNAWVEKSDPDAHKLSWNTDTENLECTETPNAIDIPLKGLYSVYIEPDDVYASSYKKDACGVAAFPIEDILSRVYVRLNNCRNLCEDFADVYVLNDQLISLCLHLDLEAEADADTVQIAVFSAIQAFFSPAPVFYNLQQMLGKNKPVDEIFEGRPYDFHRQEPLQQCGFIDTEELEAIDRHKYIYASDLYRIIMGVKGVKGINKLVMKGDILKPDEGQEWTLQIGDHYRPVLSAAESMVYFYKNKLPFTADSAKVQAAYTKNISEYNKFTRTAKELDLEIPEGNTEIRDGQIRLDEYHSVQYELPAVYYVGKNTVPDSETNKRKVQSLQLQAYLLFFDRLLADYFSQLSSIRKIFALKPAKAPSQTWFPSITPDIPMLPSLLRGYSKQTAAGCRGPVYSGMPIAYKPLFENGELPSDERFIYTDMYSRNEAARQLAAFFSNSPSQASIKTWQQEDGRYRFYLTDDDNAIVLAGYDSFADELSAKQTARDLVFLASLDICYYFSNNLELTEYGFDIIYNSAASAEITKVLYESTEEYQERKQGFLNHLLSRFSEDFTEYALIMFALNQNNPAKALEDKQRLLGSYAALSAGRGRGFNYTVHQDTLPVTGLQQKVAAMMGIEKPCGSSLNYFSQTRLQKNTSFRLMLPPNPPSGTALFETDFIFNESDKDAFGKRVLSLASDRANYHLYGCDTEKVFGFFIKGRMNDAAPAKFVTRHTVEYDTAEKRDLVADWLVSYFRNNLQYTVPVRSNEGYYFEFRDNNGIVLLRSTQGYDTMQLAENNAYRCLQLLHKRTAYKVTPRPGTSDFIIEIVDKQMENNFAIALHPILFADADTAEAALEKLYQFYLQKTLLYAEESLPLYGWEVKFKNLTSWQSSYFLQNENEFCLAFLQFLRLAANESNYLQEEQDGKFSCRIVSIEADPEKEGPDIVSTIAQHSLQYQDPVKLRDAIKAYAALFTRIQLQLTDAVISIPSGSYSLIKAGETTATDILLTIISPVPDGKDTSQMIAHIKTLAATDGCLVVKPLEENPAGCYTVQLIEEGNSLVAESRPLRSEAEAEALKSYIFQLAIKQLLTETRNESLSAWGISWKDQSGFPVFSSTSLFETQADAIVVLTDLLLYPEAARVSPVYDAIFGYGFRIYNREGLLVAGQLAWLATPEERDDLITAVNKILSAALLDLSANTVVSHNYFFSVKDETEGITWLLSPEPFKTYYEAAQAFYHSVERGKKIGSYLLTDNGCTFSFLLTDVENQIIAIHPADYPTKPERDAALQKLISFLNYRGAAINTEYLAGLWGYQIQWLACGHMPEIAFQPAQEKTTGAEMERDLEQALRLSVDSANYKIEQVAEKLWQVKLLDGTTPEKTLLAVHPVFFDCRNDAKIFIDRFVQWANKKYSIESRDGWSAEIPVHEPDKTQPAGYRVYDYRYTIAENTTLFNSRESRNDYIRLLAQQWRYRKPAHTMLEMNIAPVTGHDDLFNYKLMSAGKELWRSQQNYDTRYLAEKSFEADYINIMFLAADSSRYNTWTPGGSGIILQDAAGKPVAQIPANFDNRDAFEEAIQLRIKAAKLFPIYPVENKYGFRLYQADKNRFEWKSSALYQTTVAALEDFELFLQLLQYGGNYTVKDQPLLCNYQIMLTKVLLDINRVKTPSLTNAGIFSQETDNAQTATAENLLDLLGNLPADNSMFYTYTNYQQACRYGFRMVDKQKYRRARKIGWYNGTAERERERLNLVARLECRHALFAWTNNADDRPYLEAFLACHSFFSKVNPDNLWFSPSLKPTAANWVLAENEDKFFSYQLWFKNKDNIIWQGIENYTNECPNEDDYFYIDILELARVASAYFYEPVHDGQAYRLWLRDVDGKIIAKAPGTICNKKEDMATRMLNAILFPLVRNGRGFTFEINDLVDDDALSPGQQLLYTTIWEGVNTYPSPVETMHDFTRAMELVGDINNYQRTDEDPCGRFGLELTDPEQVQGHHPLYYTSRTQLDAAIAQTKAAINAEGFHVVEHILLRPVGQSDLQGICQLELVLYLAFSDKEELPFVIQAETSYQDTNHENEEEHLLKQIRSAVASNNVYPEAHDDYYTISFVDNNELIAVGKIARAVIPVNWQTTNSHPLSSLLDLVKAILAPDAQKTIVRRYVALDAGNCEGLLHICPPDPVTVIEPQPGLTAEDIAKCDRRFQADPYSFWATVVVPAWTFRFRSIKFRDFFESTLRKEAPSHVKLRIVWVSPADMIRFETAYLAWLATCGRKDACDYQENLTKFCEVLMTIKNVYPSASLLDDEGSNSETRTVVLDETQLGD